MTVGRTTLFSDRIFVNDFFNVKDGFLQPAKISRIFGFLYTVLFDLADKKGFKERRWGALLALKQFRSMTAFVIKRR